jgi:predicted kinase
VKLTMMRGLPGSGKTTLALQMVKEGGNSGRINRDDLRAMLFNSEWTGKREEVTIACEKAIARVLFDHSMNPIIDDTNLGQKHRQMWADFAKSAEQHFEMNDLDVNLYTCFERDSKRAVGVGRPVIERLALINGLIEWDDRQIVLVDLDGTIADGRHREHFVKGEKKDWPSYFAACGEDGYIDLVCRWIGELRQEYSVCLVSGRPDSWWKETQLWLLRGILDHGYRLDFDHVFMRSSGDKRPDTQVKADILKHLPKDKIAFVLDDRPCVIREVWRANGVRVIPVRGECEEF